MVRITPEWCGDKLILEGKVLDNEQWTAFWIIINSKGKKRRNIFISIIQTKSSWWKCRQYPKDSDLWGPVLPTYIWISLSTIPLQMMMLMARSPCLLYKVTCLVVLLLQINRHLNSQVQKFCLIRLLYQTFSKENQIFTRNYTRITSYLYNSYYLNILIFLLFIRVYLFCFWIYDLRIYKIDVNVILTGTHGVIFIRLIWWLIWGTILFPREWLRIYLKLPKLKYYAWL